MGIGGLAITRQQRLTIHHFEGVAGKGVNPARPLSKKMMRYSNWNYLWAIFLCIIIGAWVGITLAKMQQPVMPTPAPTPAVNVLTSACPVGYEKGYVWTPCFRYEGDDGCYGIRDNGMTNSVISCPQACCEDNYGGQFVSVR